MSEKQCVQCGAPMEANRKRLCKTCHGANISNGRKRAAQSRTPEEAERISKALSIGGLRGASTLHGLNLSSVDIERVVGAKQEDLRKPADTLPKGVPGYVYLLRAENGICKIGRSAVPEARISAYATHSPIDIELICLIKTRDMHRLEAELHRKYAAKRGRGEWFALDASDIEYIKSLAVE